eukprot:TRINITY_DN111783_c0_g1_i1.p2 TRINITY_DN111783_c0_g1~~TRINITY_DN111783_c0_g1_i1.p2  ORF type:complete len:103 (+),score=2.36 TRINITY_DN111783_c0_g1_i1:47-310(+)
MASENSVATPKTCPSRRRDSRGEHHAKQNVVVIQPQVEQDRQNVVFNHAKEELRNVKPKTQSVKILSSCPSSSCCSESRQDRQKTPQ